jgi:hypothetical protein
VCEECIVGKEWIMREHKPKNAAANLVCFVVVLWIILKDLWLFGVLEGADEIVDSTSEFLPPLFIGNEPIAQ